MVAEGLDVPGITGVMPIRNLGKIKFLQNMGRGTRLHIEDRNNLETGVMKVGEYAKYIKPNCWVILPYCLDNKEDFIERNIEIICSLRSDYGFDPSEHILVDVMNPGQSGPEWDEDKLGRDIRGKVINRIQECYHEIEEENNNEEIFLLAGKGKREHGVDKKKFIESLTLPVGHAIMFDGGVTNVL